ncbi:helix-turn-helix domain-containing protein [Nocardia sp. NPDC050378]|uniref:PucR family transcriptional regulator n=1 Tax=Nocardia sp. NPDC050378 TaxID=3155400 RepID=UPI0033C01A36
MTVREPQTAPPLRLSAALGRTRVAAGGATEAIEEEPTMPLDVADPPLRCPRSDVGVMTGRVVSYFVRDLARRRALLGDAVSAEISTATSMCARIGRGIVDDEDVSGEVDWLTTAAAVWAREGLSIEDILRAFHESLWASVDTVFSPRDDYDDDTLAAGLRASVRLSNLLSTTMVSAYLREYRVVAGEHHTAMRTVTSALLAGRATTTMARESGVQIADGYQVLAVSIPRRSQSQWQTGDTARRRLHRVHSALERHNDSALAILSPDGGTILIPGENPEDAELDPLIDVLSAAARAEITGAVVVSRTAEIPDAAQRAHELLDIAGRLGYPPKLYRFEDLALEYQLTRPGPALFELGELLAPLDDHPALAKTVRVLVANDMNRQRTARQLHVHTNTIIYRLSRIAALTGIDATGATGLWQLKSAVVARAFRPG